MRLDSPRSAGPDLSDRRHVVRYPCAARVRTGSRSGITIDMTSVGLSFCTGDQFTSEEIVDLYVSFDIARESPLQVVHPSRVVWTARAESGRTWRVGVEFLH